MMIVRLSKLKYFFVTIKFQVTEDELIEMSKILGKYKTLWGGVKFIEKMPLTPSGKIARKELSDMAKTFEVKMTIN